MKKQFDTVTMNKKMIEAAINQGFKINFRYINEKGEETKRTIHPWLLFKYKSFSTETTYLYVAGFCELRKDLRTFRLDRISELTLVNEYISFENIDIESLKNKFDNTFMGKIKILQSIYELNSRPKIPRSINTRKLLVDERIYGSYKAKPLLHQKPSWADEANTDKEYPKPWFSPKLVNSSGICRSPLEEIVLSMLDDDDKVISYEIEPFKIRFGAGSEESTYIPDLFITYNNGKKVIVEIKSMKDISLDINIAKFEAIEQYTIENGYIFEVWTVEFGDTVVSVNWKKFKNKTTITSDERLEKWFPRVYIQNKQETGCSTFLIIFIVIMFILLLKTQ